MSADSIIAHPPANRWRIFAAVFLIATVSYADRAVLSILLEPIKREFGMSDTAVGLLGGVPFAIFNGLFSIPAARLADRAGRGPLLLGSLVVWSVMTLSCGLAAGLVMLFVSRIGVAIGESSTAPASHALIADHFAPTERGRIFALFSMSSTVGLAMAMAIGGSIAASHGWRVAFFALAALSFPVGVFALWGLRTTGRVVNVSAGKPVETWTASFAALFRQRSFVTIVGGLTFYALFAFGPIVFTPSYLVRVLKVDLATAGSVFGAASVVGTLVGAAVSSVAIDPLTRRDYRWLAWWPAIGMLAAVPVAILTFLTDNLTLFAAGIGLLVAILYITLPAIYAAIQFVCGANRRATAVAVMTLSLSLIGGTVGPILTGVISDHAAAAGIALPLRTAMIAMAAAFLPAALLFAIAAKSIVADAQHARMAEEG